MGHSNRSFVDILNSDCLILILKAVKSNFSDSTIPIPHRIHERNTELVKLRRVRREWRDLIDSQPHLWSSIAFITGDHASMESAIMFLRNSQTATIHLYGHGGSSKLNRHTRRLARELKKQLQAASRRIVSLHIIEPTQAMLRLWPPTAPNLEVMAIDTNAPFPALFRDDMPLLRSISTPVLNENQYLMGRNLTALALSPPYTMRKLLAILEDTPMLRRLELRKILELGRDDLPRVSLPHLEALFLSGCFHPVIGFIDFPPHVRIAITIPDHRGSGLSWRDVDALSAFYIPPAFLRSSTLRITTREVRSPTSFQIVGQATGNGHRCHVYIDLEKGSSVRHRHSVCVYAVGMVRNMTSVSNILFNALAFSPPNFTPLLKRFGSLKLLTLTGPCLHPILLDLLSAGIDTFPSLERVVLDQAFVPDYYQTLGARGDVLTCYMPSTLLVLGR